jgi:hypothetical protein
MAQVEALATVPTVPQMIEALVKVWLKLFNEVPKKESLVCLLSQWYVETGGKHTYNWNIGNTKYTGKTNHNWHALNRVSEIINGKEVFFDKNSPYSRFLAFNTLEDGLSHHLTQLKNGVFRNVWKAIEVGDPAEFSRLLKANRYYTASEALYTKNMTYFFNKFIKDTTYESVVSKLPTNHIEPFSIFPLDPK